MIYKVFAIDVEDRESALDYANRLKQNKDLLDDIFAIKIGITSMLDHGLPIVRQLKETSGLPIICDLKLAEIPEMAIKIAKKVEAAGADYLVLHAFVGEAVIKRIKKDAPNLQILLVSEMTHNDGGFTHRHLEEFAAMAERERVFGIIGPGNRPERLGKIKAIIGNKVKLFATGFGDQGGEEAGAINAGAEYLIEGRIITRDLGVDESKKKSLKGIFLVLAVIYTLVGISLALFFHNFEAFSREPVATTIISTVLGFIGALIPLIMYKRR